MLPNERIAHVLRIRAKSGWSRKRSKGDVEVESARLPARRVSRVGVKSGCEQPQQEASYSITSSAMASRDGGTVRPSAFRVLELDDELTFGHLLDARTAGTFGGSAARRWRV